jgi:hypothetical protein
VWEGGAVRTELFALYWEASNTIEVSTMTAAHTQLERMLERRAEKQCRLALSRRSGEPCIGVPSITRHEIAMVVAAHRPKVQECYRTALKSKPGLSGKLTARFELTDSGTTVKIAKSDLGDEPMEKCVLERLGQFRFPPLRYRVGQKVTVNYPFVFHPDHPEGQPSPRIVQYRVGDTFAVSREGDRLIVIFPAKAKELLASAFPEYRIPESEDFERNPGLPYEFTAAANFDRMHGDDLAIVLVHKEEPARWRLVAIHDQPEGYRPVLVTDFEGIASYFRVESGRRPNFFVTGDARCFCDRQCLAIASDIGKSFEFEWNGTAYVGVLENYLK